MNDIEKKEIVKVEEILKQYKILKIELEAININIKFIGQKAVKYTGMLGTNNISNTVHNNLIELESLEDEKYNTEFKIDQITLMLNVLNEEEYKIIKLIYFDEYEIYKVAHIVNMHPNTLYKKRKKIFSNKLIPYSKRFKLI